MPQTDSSSGAGRRILVVEDEYMIADMISTMVEDLGYEVVGPVATIPEAITAIAGEKLDVVLLDANLDGVSSAPVAAELAARGLPFVVVTGYGSLDLTSADLQSAPRMNKPFTAAALAAILAKTAA